MSRRESAQGANTFINKSKRLFPKLHNDTPLSRAFRHDLFLAITAFLVGPLLFYSAVSLAFDGRLMMASVTLVVLVFFIAISTGFIKFKNQAIVSRAGLGVILALAGLEIVTLQNPYLYFWLTLVPLGSMFVLGWREGLWWSLAVALATVFSFPQLSAQLDGMTEDFYLMYVFATALAWAYDWLREQAQKVADQRLADLETSEKQLRAGELELAQAQKMRAIGQLTSGVAHDFNNMLMVVRGNLELATLKKDQDISDNLNNALSAVDSATDLIDKLLTFSRRKALRPETIDANDVIKSTQMFLARSLGANIKLQLNLADDLWLCKADPTQLENSLLNLAINARDAMPDGGTLTFTTQNITQPLADNSQEQADYVCIRVEDTGAGIPEELQAMVFEPFFTTKPPGAGSGLGLSMVHGFVGQSGGYVSLESEPGQYTRVNILLPRTHERAQSSSAAIPASTIETKGVRILILEDDEPVASTLTQMLRELGCLVATANTTAQAKTLLAERTPDLVIADVILAERESGLDFLQHMRAVGITIPALLISGYAPESIGIELPEDIALLSKPISTEQLAAAVTQAKRQNT